LGDRGYTTKYKEKFYIILGNGLPHKSKYLVYLHELGHILDFTLIYDLSNTYEINEFHAYIYSYILARKLGLKSEIINELVQLRNKAYILSEFETTVFSKFENYKAPQEKNNLFYQLISRSNENIDSSLWQYELDLYNYPFMWSSVYFACERALLKIQKENFL